MTRRLSSGPSTVFERLARGSASMTRDRYKEIEHLLTRPLTLGPRRGAAHVSQHAAPAATRTSAAERALLAGDAPVSVSIVGRPCST